MLRKQLQQQRRVFETTNTHSALPSCSCTMRLFAPAATRRSKCGQGVAAMCLSILGIGGRGSGSVLVSRSPPESTHVVRREKHAVRRRTWRRWSPRMNLLLLTGYETGQHAVVVGLILQLHAATNTIHCGTYRTSSGREGEGDFARRDRFVDDIFMSARTQSMTMEPSRKPTSHVDAW